MRTTYGYDAYRGRSRARTFLMVLIVILVGVLALAVAAFFLLQDHIYYGDDGRAHVDLPFLQVEDTPAPSAPAESAPIVVFTPEPTATPEPVVEESLTAVELPLTALTDGAALAQVQAAGGNTALFDMKTDEGLLSYVSEVPQAVELRTSAAQPELNEAIRAGNAAEGLYTIARVSCFKDNTAPRRRNSMSLRSSAGNWLDGSGFRWTSPAVADTQAYLAGVCGELAALGFDEIWLDNAAYPTVGDPGRILQGDRYDPAAFGGTLDSFYGQVAQALAAYPDVKLSISTTATVLTGAGDASGQTLELLGKYAGRVYAPGPADEAASRAYDSALTAMGLTPAGLVYTTEPYEPDPSSSYRPLGGRIAAVGP